MHFHPMGLFIQYITHRAEEHVQYRCIIEEEEIPDPSAHKSRWSDSDSVSQSGAAEGRSRFSQRFASAAPTVLRESPTRAVE